MFASCYGTKSGGRTPEYAHAYLTGPLWLIQRKNMVGLAESVPDVPWQNRQQFLSNSAWEWDLLWKWLGREGSEDFGGEAGNMLVIDESVFAKKGERPVGMARQYSERQKRFQRCWQFSKW
jgi:SRSO17 transposase